MIIYLFFLKILNRPRTSLDHEEQKPINFALNEKNLKSGVSIK